MSEQNGSSAAHSRTSVPADWPEDINRRSGFRLPLLSRDELDDVCKRLYDRASGGGNIAGLQGPSAISFYSPRTAGHRNSISQYLRHEAGLGPRVREIALLITSRSMNTQFEWTAHEPEAIKAGVPQEVIDVIKFHRPTEGLDPVDVIVIELGRAIWKDHQVSSELFAQAKDVFGAGKLVDLVLLMGTHASSGALLTAFAMQLHEGDKPLLPIP